MSSSSFRSFRHRVEYLGVVGVMRIVSAMPRRLSLGCGTLLGYGFYVIDAHHRNLTIHNLQRAFPTRAPRELRRIARGVFRHFGRLLMEVLRFNSLSADEKRGLVEFEGDDRVRHALAQGRGVLIVTGHFGFWELQGMAHGLALPPINVVARRLDNPGLNDLLERVRQHTGNTVIYRHNGLRRIMRALNSNQGVAVLIDQHMGSSDAVIVDFFDRPAATTSAVAALALRTGAAVIPAFSLPMENGRYRFIYEHAVPLPDPESPDAIRELTQKCTDVLEMYVRRYPELWLWMHRRWRDDAVDSDRPMFPAGASEEVR